MFTESDQQWKQIYPGLNSQRDVLNRAKCRKAALLFKVHQSELERWKNFLSTILPFANGTGSVDTEAVHEHILHAHGNIPDNGGKYV